MLRALIAIKFVETCCDLATWFVGRAWYPLYEHLQLFNRQHFAGWIDAKKTMARCRTVPSMQLPHSSLTFRALRDELRRGGFLECDPAWYAWRTAGNFLMLAISFYLLASAEGAVLICLSALLLAFVFVQIGFVAHDAQHGQIARHRAARLWLALVHWNLLTGISQSWWQDRHMRHHLNPNLEGGDPDMYPMLTYSKEQALCRHGLARVIARRQLWWYLPLLACVAVYFRYLSIAYLLQRRQSGYVRELVLLGLHHVLYFGLILHFLAPWPAFGFVLLNYAATGWYMGAVFSTNHSAMPLAMPGPRRLDQLRSTRNVATGPIGDFMFGGLNYQIEHHLFPSMPRSRLRQASARVRAFCEQHDLPYNRCSLASTYQAIAADLHDIGAPLRAGTENRC